MENYILRSGGLIPTFYIKDGLFTCHPDEAKRLSKEEADAIVKRLQDAEEVNCWGTKTLRAIPA